MILVWRTALLVVSHDDRIMLILSCIIRIRCQKGPKPHERPLAFHWLYQEPQLPSSCTMAACGIALLVSVLCVFGVQWQR